MKVIIEDLVKRHEGGKEVELPKGTTIRFEFGETALSCTIDNDGLNIYKCVIRGDDWIKIEPRASNKILLK